MRVYLGKSICEEFDQQKKYSRSDIPLDMQDQMKGVVDHFIVHRAQDPTNQYFRFASHRSILPIADIEKVEQFLLTLIIEYGSTYIHGGIVTQRLTPEQKENIWKLEAEMTNGSTRNNG